MVGVRGFEPLASCSQNRRSARLSYTPKLNLYSFQIFTMDTFYHTHCLLSTLFLPLLHFFLIPVVVLWDAEPPTKPLVAFPSQFSLWVHYTKEAPACQGLFCLFGIFFDFFENTTFIRHLPLRKKL
jgi:hypothetical protein